MGYDVTICTECHWKKNVLICREQRESGESVLQQVALSPHSSKVQPPRNEALLSGVGLLQVGFGNWEFQIA